jgi:DNA (cytosine-5)-methyltransferase 1
VENVPDLLIRGIERVLGDLAAGGYDAEWEVLPAAAFGAIHIRERVFLLGMDSNITGNGYGPISAIRPKRIVGSNALYSRISKTSWWETEPGVVRVVNGFPGRMDRIKALGNAVVPQVVEMIGRAIMEVEK